MSLQSLACFLPCFPCASGPVIKVPNRGLRTSYAYCKRNMRRKQAQLVQLAELRRVTRVFRSTPWSAQGSTPGRHNARIFTKEHPPCRSARIFPNLQDRLSTAQVHIQPSCLKKDSSQHVSHPSLIKAACPCLHNSKISSL